MALLPIIGALAIVVLGPFALAGLAIVALRWAMSCVARSPLTGGIGVVVTAAAVVAMLVPRTCTGAGGVRIVNRPLLSLAVEHGNDACVTAGLSSVALVAVLAAATSVAVRLPALARR